LVTGGYDLVTTLKSNVKDPQPNELNYRTDLINGAMGERRLTNQAVAEKATEIRRQADPDALPVSERSVSAIRNGSPNVQLRTLKAVVEAVGLTMEQVFQTKAEGNPATTSV
jgi:hypothetical protein